MMNHLSLIILVVCVLQLLACTFFCCFKLSRFVFLDLAILNFNCTFQETAIPVEVHYLIYCPYSYRHSLEWHCYRNDTQIGIANAVTLRLALLRQ